MSNHFFAINRGNDGFKFSDFTLGTSSSASADFELRVADVDGQSKVVTRKDIVKALEAFRRVFEQGGLQTTFPPI